jgi:DNA-binding NarL/FixJ family response regulator
MVAAPVRDARQSRTVIVQPDALCREGLIRLVGEFPGVQLAAAAATAAEALAALQESGADLVLTDLDLPDHDGLEWLTLLTRLPHSPQVVVLSRQVGLAYVMSAMVRGARGYLPRSSAPADLREAFRRVQAGHIYVHPSLSAGLVGLKLGGASGRDLTDRECTLLVHLARGATNQEIAAALYISEKTVRNTLTRLFQKRGARNRTEGVAAGRELGYL